MIKVLVVGPAGEARQRNVGVLISEHVCNGRNVAAYEATGRYQASLVWGHPAGFARTDVLVVQGDQLDTMAELTKVLAEAHSEIKPAQPVPDTNPERVPSTQEAFS